MASILNWVAFAIVLITTASILLHQNWRWGLGFLALQYVGVFLLVQTHWTISMAAAKLITGWMACVILAMGRMNASVKENLESSWPQGRLFRIFTGGIIVAVTFVLSLSTSTWLGLDLPIAWAALLLISMGLLQLGITDKYLWVIAGLLTTLAGFEVIYASVESSILVAALLAVVNLGLALTGAYLLTQSEEANA
jgi:hypothetical protein